MSTTPDELIVRHIELDPEAPGPIGARIADAGVHVWALIGYFYANGGQRRLVAEDYELPEEAVEAALAYYERHRALIDARLGEHSTFFAMAWQGSARQGRETDA